MYVLKEMFAHLVEGIKSRIDLATKVVERIGNSTNRLILSIDDDAVTYQSFAIATTASKTINLPDGIASANVWATIHVECNGVLKATITNATSGNTGSFLIQGDATYGGFAIWHIEPYTDSIVLYNGSASTILVRVTVTKLPSLVTNASFKGGRLTTGVSTPT